MDFSKFILAAATAVILGIVGWAGVRLLRRSVPLLSHPAWQGVGAITGIAIALIPILLPLFNPPSPITLTMRIASNSNVPVANAKVLLFHPSGAFSTYTDSNGIASFILQSPNSTGARLFIETDEFPIYDQEISLSGNQAVDIHLTPRDADNRSIIVRVINESGNPEGNATVGLIASGEVLSQITDANGLTKFIIPFSSTTLDAEISVTTTTSNMQRQNVTLRPNQVQDIQLNTATGIVIVATPNIPTAIPPCRTPVPSDIEPTAVPFNTNITAEISSPAQSHGYILTGNTGNIVEINTAVTSGFLWPRVRIFDVSCSNPTPLIDEHSETAVDARVEITFVIPKEGIYRIVINDFEGTRTGTYDLFLYKIS